MKTSSNDDDVDDDYDYDDDEDGNDDDRFLSGYLLDVNASSNSGETALHLASRFGFVDLVDTLLENGASVRERKGRGRGREGDRQTD